MVQIISIDFHNLSVDSFGFFNTEHVSKCYMFLSLAFFVALLTKK